MIQSEQINELAAALSKAQAEIVGAVKDSTNPHFKSSFASLESVIDCVRTPLAKNGLAYAQGGATSNHLETVLMHSSGQWIATYTPLINPKGDMQGLGSAMTYARRYALSALLGVPQIDDDGNNASHPPISNKTAAALDAQNALSPTYGKPKCCGKDLILSAKGSYYCQNWQNKAVQHIVPVLKHEYDHWSVK